MSDNKRIAKNTLFLYFRMLLIMGVSLYTSRIVLDKLGVNDYGLYNVVGGVVGMLSFVSGTLSIGTLRFLTYEIGRNDKQRLRLTFNTGFYTHLVLALILAFLLETGGLWFVYNKLVIPIEKISAAVIVYHISVLTSIVAITLVPFTSLIMAHERMSIYAYISIFEAIAKLLVVYLLGRISNYDNLIVYAVLLALVQLGIAISYYTYCTKYFSEAKIGFVFDNNVFKSMMKFSGWNILANLAETLKLQGYLILLNMFFMPAVVAAQTIANQVAGAMMQFVNNFRNAINPQIIKLYAAEQYIESKKLTLNTTVMVFDMVLLLGLPTIFVMDTIMNIWLIEVPPYAVVFAQYTIAQRILSTFDTSFYTPMMAEGKIKTNSIFATFTGPGLFLTLYIIYNFKGDVMWMQYVGLFSLSFYGFLLKPYLLVHDEKGYSYSDFIPCFCSCLKVTILSLLMSFVAYVLVGNSHIINAICLFIISFLSVAFSSYIFMSNEMKIKIREMIQSAINRLYNIKQ